MSTPLEHPFITHQPGFPQAPPPTSGLSIQAQSDEIKYQAKYRELRFKVKAIESENDKLQAKVLNVKKNIQRLRLERAILYERLMSISGANGAPPNPNANQVPPGVVIAPPATQAASYYQSAKAQSPFPNAAHPKAHAGSSHHHHHGHHHHHHHHSQTGPPPTSGSGGVEYSHGVAGGSLGLGGERYYSNEPRGPSPGPSHLQHNGQSSSRREARSSGELTPGRGAIGHEHGMPPPPTTLAPTSSGRMYGGYGHGQYGSVSVKNGDWEVRRGRSNSVRSERDHVEDHVEDHDE